jgi:hypothetical protein
VHPWLYRNLLRPYFHGKESGIRPDETLRSPSASSTICASGRDFHHRVKNKNGARHSQQCTASASGLVMAVCELLQQQVYR